MDSEAPLAVEPTTKPSPNWQPQLVPSLVVCLASGLLGAAIVHGIDPYFKFASLPELGISPSPELVQRFNAAQHAFHTQNLALNLGLIGLCLGLAIGAITTPTRRVLSGFAAGLGGMLGGAVSGYLVGIFVAKAIIASADQSLVQSGIFHFAAWAGMLGLLMGAVGCIQLGVLRACNIVLVGILIGVAVSTVHNIMSSVIFPTSNLLLVIPGSLVERIVWISLASIVLAFGLHYGLREKPSAPANVE